MIPIKTDKEIAIMRKAGKILSGIMKELKDRVRVGITTKDLDDLALGLMQQESVTSAFKNYRGYPANICTSLNDEIVHGIPDASRLLNEGDIISLDVGIFFEGYCSDAAITLPVGRVDFRKKKLVDVARQALFQGIKQARINKHLSDISHAIQAYVEANGFSVVRDFVGHGIGTKMHEEPEIPNFGQPNQGPLLKKGMVFTIEPMVNMGVWEARITDNGWTAVTKDKLPSAHFEHTVAITDEGLEILTA